MLHPYYDDSARDTKRVPSSVFPASSWNPDKRLTSLLLRRGWELHNTNNLLVKWDEANVIKKLNGLLDESSDIAVAFRFFKWPRRHKGTRHGTRVVCTMIHIVVSRNVNNLAMDFLRGIVKNSDGRKDWLDLIFDVLSETSRDRGVLEIAYSMLVCCYVRLRMIDMAVKLVGGMKNFGFFPSTRIHDCLISALLESNQFDYACDLFRDSQSSRCDGNRSISLFIWEVCARSSFRTACKLHLDTQNDSGILDIVAYTIVIDVLCKRGFIKEAIAILCKLIHTGATLDFVLLAVVVDGFCKAKVLREIGNRVKEMRKLGPVDILIEVHEVAEELQKKIDRCSYLLVNSKCWEIGSRLEEVQELSGKTLNSRGAMERSKCLMTKSHSENILDLSTFKLSSSWDDRKPTKPGVKPGVEPIIVGSPKTVAQNQIAWPAWGSLTLDEAPILEESKTYESASALSLATFTSLLIEFVARLQKVVKAFQELSEKAKFKDSLDEPVADSAGLWNGLSKFL